MLKYIFDKKLIANTRCMLASTHLDFQIMEKLLNTKLLLGVQSKAYVQLWKIQINSNVLGNDRQNTCNGSIFPVGETL